MQYDAIVVGGSYAGLAAATQLARARRRVLVIDAGMRRNRFAGHSHGYLTQDGTPAAEIARIGRMQLMKYDTVQWIEGTASDAEKTATGFRVALYGGEVAEARRLVLALGVTDRLPEVAGLAERWGRYVFHCPYCHGYELNQGRIGVLATSQGAMHFAQMLPDWGQTTLFLNDAFEPDAEQRALLKARGVTVVTGRVDRLKGEVEVVLVDDRVFTLHGVFVTTSVSVSSPLAEQLGCEFDEGPMGQTIKTDGVKRTSVAGVYACGDAARPGGSVPLAVGDGTLAGAMAHQSLIFGI